MQVFSPLIASRFALKEMFAAPASHMLCTGVSTVELGKVKKTNKLVKLMISGNFATAVRLGNFEFLYCSGRESRHDTGTLFIV